jgi:hypothetical protein
MLFCLLPMIMWCTDIISCAAGKNPFTDARWSWQDSEVAAYHGYHRRCQSCFWEVVEVSFGAFLLWFSSSVHQDNCCVSSVSLSPWITALY